jgi:hypothetical protein
MLIKQVESQSVASLLPKLRDDFAEFLNHSYLEHLRILSSTTCVGLRYGHLYNSLRRFSRQYGPNHFMALRASSSRLRIKKADLPALSPYTLEPGLPSPGWSYLLRHSIAQTLYRWYRNINLLSIDYAFRPRLRFRLTLGGSALPRKP